MEQQEKKLAKESIGQLVPDASASEAMPKWISDLLENQKKLLQTNTELREKMDQLEADNKVFRGLAGKNAIQSWLEAQKDFTQKFAHLKVWNDKPIVAWKKLDLSKRNPYAKDALSENIFIPVIFKDGSEESINYSDFTNIKELVKVKLLGEINQQTEHIQCQFSDETVMAIETKFLNA